MHHKGTGRSSSPNRNSNNAMTVVVKRIRTRPGGGLLQARNSDRSVTSTVSKTIAGKKSTSASSLKSNNSADSSNCYQRGKPSAVCFAQDYDTPDEVIPSSAGVLSESERKASFYTADDLNRFDKDRALTALMYKTRKSNGANWDDNFHSIRGLEEILSTNYGSSTKSSGWQQQQQQPPPSHSKRNKRKTHVDALLKEQARLQSSAGQAELAAAAKAIRKSESDLYNELLRGVSCSQTKIDKQRALQLAQKDERASALSRQGSARKLLKKVKSKLHMAWASTSSRSVTNTNAGGSSSDKVGDNISTGTL